MDYLKSWLIAVVPWKGKFPIPIYAGCLKRRKVAPATWQVFVLAKFIFLKLFYKYALHMIIVKSIQYMYVNYITEVVPPTLGNFEISIAADEDILESQIQSSLFEMI